MKQRLQKYMASAGVASRRAAEKMILEGRVKVNGRVASLGESVGLDDSVLVDGKPLRPDEKVYLMLHKPMGYTTTVRDEHAESTVMDLLGGFSTRVFPVGRLDKDTEGLLLFTNDGELTYLLLHPSRHVGKTYLVEVEGQLLPRDVESLQVGIELYDGVTAPATVTSVKHGEKTTVFTLTIYEGRKRQVRRMCGALGRRVVHLKRVAVGELELGSLELGMYRHLTEREVKDLYHSASGTSDRSE